MLMIGISGEQIKTHIPTLFVSRIGIFLWLGGSGGGVVGGDVPIIGRCEDGNASDKRLNNALLSQISQHLKRFGIDEWAFLRALGLSPSIFTQSPQAG